MAVISDNLVPVDIDGDMIPDANMADLVSSQDYEPFGSLLPGRNYRSNSYRHGFSGMEKDDEMHGATGTSYDFGARLYDPKVGRWLSIDPLASKYPSQSPYNFVGNNPVLFVDCDGMDYGIYIDHNNKTIVIRANVYHTSRDAERTQAAVNHWNTAGDGFVYQVTDPTSGKVTEYAVSYELTAIETNIPFAEADRDAEGNSFSAMPDDFEGFSDKAGGAALGITYGGKHIAVHDSDQDEPFVLEEDAHEVGHLLTYGWKVSKDPHSSKEGDLMNPALSTGGVNIG